jgi:flagellar biosynthesis protein FliR
MAIGTLIGALASLLFLTLHFELLFLPFLLVIFVLRPVRRRVFPRRAARTAVR